MKIHILVYGRNIAVFIWVKKMIPCKMHITSPFLCPVLKLKITSEIIEHSPGPSHILACYAEH